MLKTGILNPALLHLLARIRHTNTLVISDRGFPFWPQIETVDLSLIDGIPSVPQVIAAIRANFVIGRAWMAQEFVANNTASTQTIFRDALGDVPLIFESHVDLKKRVPFAIGLIRTGETVQYANTILESA